ncbi:MAG: 4-alpha-glucanotransferase [Gammaproteobacteria bacterium]|nr:4-alpha-glucanotransferase [Gammaproteobacteria bacterium]
MTGTGKIKAFNFSEHRRAGILLHPTSLPGGQDHGDLGHDAYRFIEFLAASGISVWQTLPLGPTHEDGSPYQCLSAHAGNPDLISLDWLIDKNWLDVSLITSDKTEPEYREQCLKQALAGFTQQADSEQQQAYTEFCSRHQGWLDDYCLFVAIKQHYNGKGWTDWPTPLRLRDPNALEEISQALADKIEQARFEQFIFFSQWVEIRDYAHQHGVYIFGDMPIFVAHDSADVWSKQEYFLLDEQGQATVIAGVPPDYFSETGQRWGNPLYNWPLMIENGFEWWVDRIRTQLELFDIVRVDHFRGFEAYWEIPATEETAINGHWVKAPGEALLKTLYETFSDLSLVAEDLGIITAEVDALRKDFHLPGMKILQFAFGGDASNPYLPHNHEACSVVYTGTHDNDTTLSWYTSLPEEQQKQILEYMGCKSDADMPWPIIKMALASVADMAVLPMQDILALDGEHRMNKPGTTEGNWNWRFEWEQIPAGLAEKMQVLIKRYGRKPA